MPPQGLAGILLVSCLVLFTNIFFSTIVFLQEEEC